MKGGRALSLSYMRTERTTAGEHVYPKSCLERSNLSAGCHFAEFPRAEGNLQGEPFVFVRAYYAEGRIDEQCDWQ